MVFVVVAVEVTDILLFQEWAKLVGTSGKLGELGKTIGKTRTGKTIGDGVAQLHGLEPLVRSELYNGLAPPILYHRLGGRSQGRPSGVAPVLRSSRGVAPRLFYHRSGGRSQGRQSGVAPVLRSSTTALGRCRH